MSNSEERDQLLSEYSDAYKAWCGSRPRGFMPDEYVSNELLAQEIDKLYNWANAEHDERAKHQAEVVAKRKAGEHKAHRETHPTMASIWPACA